MGWSGGRRVVVVLAAVYLVGLAVLVAGPWGWALNRFTVACYVHFRYDWPIAPDWVLPEHYGVLLNVLLFVPLGALVVLLTARARWIAVLTAVLAAAAGSTAIEVVQGAFLAREATWQDVAANTVGAALGALAVTLLRPRPPRSPRR